MNAAQNTSSPSPWSRVAATVGLLTAVVAVLLTAFAWPSVRSHPHDVPIAVAGPPAAVAKVRTALDRARPGAFAVTEVADAAAAERLVRDRAVYGAVDAGPGGPRVFVASAASPVVAQSLQGLGAALAPAPRPSGGGAPAAGPVTDLVPLPAEDPRGAGLSAGALPLVMGGLLAAVVLTRFVRGTSRRVVGALAFALTGGAAVAALLQFWLGSLGGSYAANAGAVALAVAATSVSVIGLEALLGTAGLAIGGVTMMLIGNPLSGTATAPEMLPGWSGEFGGLLPPGAGGRLLRSTAFFDGHGAASALTVLGVWLAVGALLCLAGTLRTRHTTAPVRPA
ncbi:ABC transporter permease [Streptomyces fradiae]|uniref:ABC transporter permease n=1 Tax=Streptomyces fradiae TaxID=1906 RepID=UPI0035164A7E